MDSQEATNNATEPSSARGMSIPVVKQNVPLAAGLQVRPQGPPTASPRFPANNQAATGPRPAGPQPIRRLDSRTSLGPTGPAQYPQVRPYGPPRPPGNSFPPRPVQPGQTFPQNFHSPQGPLNPQNPQNFLPRPAQSGPPAGVRGPASGPRPPFLNNHQNQQPPRNGNEQQSAQKPTLEPTRPLNGQQTQRPNQESPIQSKLQVNNSNSSQQSNLSIGQSNQITVPRNTAKKMADVEKPKSELQNTITKKKGEFSENGENDDDDDDDDVVMDDEKSAKQNGSVSTNVDADSSKTSMNPENESGIVSKAESTISNGKTTPKPLSRPATAKLGDNEPATRPVTATISNKIETAQKIENTRRTSTESIEDKKSLKGEDDKLDSKSLKKSDTENEEVKNVPNIPTTDTIDVKTGSDAPVIAQTVSNQSNSRPVTATLNQKEQLDSSTKSARNEPETSANSNHDNKVGEQPVQITSKIDNVDSSKKTSPAKTDNEIKKSSDDGSSTRPSTAKIEKRSNTNETNNKVEKTVKNSPKATNKENERPPSDSRDSSNDSPNKSRASTPGEVKKSDEVSADKPSENPPRDKAEDTSKNRSPSSAKNSDRSVKSPTSTETQKLAVPGSLKIPPKSPDGVKGYDNGQRRSLSSRSSPSHSPLSPNSPNSPISPKSQKSSKSPVNEAKTPEGEKKKTTFAEDTLPEKTEKPIVEKETNSSGSRGSSKPATPTKSARRPQTPIRQEKPQTVQNGTTANESTQNNSAPTTNGVESSPIKKTPSKTRENDKRSIAGSPVKSPSKSVKSLPRTPETSPSTTCQEKKKLPMNKIQVGAAPSPNLKTVRSKIGSLDNASYKPGGGNVKIENRKLDFSKAQPKIAAKNEKYTPSGGDKKIAQQKLQWNAKPKVGSLENATYKPGGGDKKIETVKLDFKDKAKPKVGSKDNVKHVPGGGSVKSSATPPKTPQDTSNDIQTQKIEIKAESKVGSLDNVKHKPGGGASNSNSSSNSNGNSNQVQSPPAQSRHNSDKRKETAVDLPQPPPSTPTRGRSVTSASSPVTPRAVRSSLAKSPEATAPKSKSIEEKKSGRNSKNSTPQEKSPVSPTSPLSSPQDTRAKSPRKSSSSRKSSPKGLKLPKLAISPVGHNVSAPVEPIEHRSKITLPKLIEPTTQATRVSH